MYTSMEIRQPGHAVHAYKCFQILINDLNDVIRDYFMMFVNDLSITLAVICNFMLIRFHDKLNSEVILISIVFSIITTAFLFISYIQFGEINEMSKSFVNSWKRNNRHIECVRERKLMKKYIKACPLLKVELGSFTWYKKPTSIRIIGKLVTYTVKFTMLMKKLQFFDRLEVIKSAE